MREQHRHFWTRDDDAGPWACRECAETSETCFECDRWTGSSLLICERCIGRARRILDDIETAMALYQPQPRSAIPAVRYDRDRISGSYAQDYDPLRWTLHDLPEILAGWADHWAEQAEAERTLGALDFLRGRILWAAHNRDASDWAQWLTEMRHALVVAKLAAGVLPKRMPAPCALCGGPAVQDWADGQLRPFEDGLADLVRCLGCRTTWTSAAHFGWVSKTHLRELPDKRPEALVTVEQARLVWPDIPVKTWRTWADRDEMPEPASWDVRGVPQYRVCDLEPLTVRRLDETRQGRRAG